MPRAAAIPAAQRRAHAVEALLDLARDTCPDQVSSAAVAKRMGISHGALFHHFPSRDALWVEAVTWAIDELERHFETTAAGAAVAGAAAAGAAAAGAAIAADRAGITSLPLFSNPLQRVADLMASQAALLQHHPGLVRLLVADLQRPATSAARKTGKASMQRLRRRQAQLIAAAQAGGTLEPNLDPQELAALLVASQQGLMLQALAHDDFADLAERSGRFVTLLLRIDRERRQPGAAA